MGIIRAYLQPADWPNQWIFVVRCQNFAFPKLGESEFDSVPTKPQWYTYRSSKDKLNIIHAPTDLSCRKFQYL